MDFIPIPPASPDDADPIPLSRGGLGGGIDFVLIEANEQGQIIRTKKPKEQPK